MIKKEELLKIGRFSKPHGVKGELSILTEMDLFDNLEDPYIVCDIDGIMVPFFIEEYRYKGNSVILVKLEYVNSEESAHEFVSRDVYFPLSAMSDEDLEEQMTWDNFIGYTVTDTENGILGEITGIDESTMNILFQIDSQGKELLFPVAEELITGVDHKGKQLSVTSPEGLLDL